ncbi:hypothetical protein BJY24_001083 [Nocardia transvalensis]|uniref:Uncharacterized protein n=1 Tax=Nocardia transvalensis TaxID=37333 RepID=A0A7W9PA43_9NOCA|nr:hypothetical protein [Nocardia transvalensis]MBB5912216.1 hypothetical protein [Nocardia transvalensis]
MSGPGTVAVAAGAILVAAIPWDGGAPLALAGRLLVAVLVLAGLRSLWPAGVAVVLAAAAMARFGASAGEMALAGLAATAYLAGARGLAHRDDRIELSVRAATAGGYGLAAWGACAAVVAVPWAPLLAPVAGLIWIVLSLRALYDGGRRAGRQRHVRGSDQADDDPAHRTVLEDSHVGISNNR